MDRNGHFIVGASFTHTMGLGLGIGSLQMQQQLEARIQRYIPSSGGGMPDPDDMQNMAQQA